MIYFILEFTSSALILYPSIMILINLCKNLNKIQTLSNVTLFRGICFIFICLDIFSRIYGILYLTYNYKLNKLMFGIILSWLTTFISLVISLFMIRNESISCFNYIKDVIDESRKLMLCQTIFKLNVLCFSFLIYTILMFIQINIEIFGENNTIDSKYQDFFYMFGLFNQWLLANPLLMAAILFYLKPTITTNSSTFNENPLFNHNSKQFRLLSDVQSASIN